jgi:glycosyltransferase involved in cell wall biosynthesis
MSDLPKITIITPSYNQGDFISETIDSVLSQGYPNLEYFVIDGGSVDNTIDILRTHGEDFYWISEPDKGQSHAINKGLLLATGDVIAFLNSDDLYEPGALLKVGEFFANKPGTDWVTGKCRIINQDGCEIRKAVTMYKNFWLRINSYSILLITDYVSQPATFWRRQVITKVGSFDENLQYAMDYDYSLRVGKYFKLWVLDHYLASYRIHPRSKAGSSANKQFDTDLEIAKRHSISPICLFLHELHNALIVKIYRSLPI